MLGLVTAADLTGKVSNRDVWDIPRRPSPILEAKAKAEGWPLSIYSDPDVLTLDKHGHFIICGVCAEYYAMRWQEAQARGTQWHARAQQRQGERNLSSRPAIAPSSTSAVHTWLLPSFRKQRLSEYTPIRSRLHVHNAALLTLAAS